MMGRLLTEKRRFLSDLFTGPFPGHALSMMPVIPRHSLGDFACSREPVARWVPGMIEQYEILARYAEVLDLDCIPFVNLNTNTGIFAAAFGCQIHVYGDMDTNACALPAVETAAQTDALPMPDLFHVPTICRIFELGALLRDQLGPDVPIGVPDIQSPFDIAALVWKKEELLAAMIEAPDSVKCLVGKCHLLLNDFLTAFKREFPNCNLSHCPVTAWAPSETGCWLSEDEAGTISAAMFEEFALPTLVALSTAFGGMYLHCCAAADHQYENFARIPNLRGLNRVFQSPGAGPAISRFSRHTVLIQAWIGEAEVRDFLSQALPETRYYFELSPMAIADAAPVIERLRDACVTVAGRKQ